MKKINWGTGIAVFYSIFALTMVGFVIKSTFSPVLIVKKNYFDDDINYQRALLKKQNTTLLGNDMSIQYIAEANTVVLKFPLNLAPPVGNVTFFRPSETDKDRIFELKTDPARQMFIRVDDFQKGLWRVQVEWQAEDKTYFKEEKIVIEPNDWARPIHK